MATTILDRLMHRAHILEFEGKSYRLKEGKLCQSATDFNNVERQRLDDKKAFG
jgi:hypothetical protein